MKTCKDCIYRAMCYKHEHYGYDDEQTCEMFKNKSDFVEVKKISEQVIRKKAEVSDYWQNDVKRYRAMQGYLDIEHDVDNFLRGYNEAVEDILAIIEGGKKE